MRWVGTLTLLFLAACGAASDGEAVRMTTKTAPHRRATAAAPRGVLPRRMPRSRIDPTPATERGPFGFVPDPSREPVDPPPPGTWVRGRVTDAGDVPIAHANVAVFLGVSSVKGDADEDGNFAIDVDDPTGVARCVAWAEDRAAAAGPWLALREGETIDAGTIRLEPGVRIEGRISKPDGSNAYGTVSVDWTDAYDPETWALVRECTQLDRVDVPYSCAGPGGFAISCLRRGRYRLSVANGGETRNVDAPAQGVVLAAPPAPGPDAFDLDLRVTDFDDSLVTEFTAKVSPRAVGQTIETTWIERDGRRLLHVTSSSTSGVIVTVTAPDGRSARRDVMPRSRGPVEIQLPRRRPDGPRLTIGGKVTFGGRPLTRLFGSSERVRVFAYRADAECGGAWAACDGSFVIEDLDEGPYELWAYTEQRTEGAPKLASARVLTCAGRDDVLVEIPASLSRTFRLVLPEGFDRVDDYDAEVKGPDDGIDDPGWKRTGTDLVVDCLRENVTYSLSLRVRCGAASTATTRVASFFAGDAPIELRLDPGLRISGRVVREDDTPVAGAYVEAANGSDGDAWAYCGLDGTFTLTGLDPGSWSIEVSAPGLSMDEAGVVVAAGERDVRVVLRADR